MRIFQNVLVVVGATALGTVLGFFGLALFIASLQRPGGEPWQAGYGQFLGGFFCGMPVGAIVGLVLSACWIMRREVHRGWGPLIWMGVVLGLTAGLAWTFRWNARGGPGWWVAALLMPACGAVGGMFASLVTAIRAGVRTSH